MSDVVRDGSGRILAISAEDAQDPDLLAAAIAERDAADAANLATLRSLGRLGNQWSD